MASSLATKPRAAPEEGTKAAPPLHRRLLRLWEVPFIAALASFMFWVRMLPYQALVTAERAYFVGTDPFYHYRETLGIVRAFPRVPRWDPWTYYPNGTGTGQFGSLFDWTAAAWVVLTQGRDASEAYVQQVLGAYPAVLGAVLIVPFYFLAKRLLGTAGAVVASVTLALLPGEFLIRSIAGYSDHHVAEALFALVSIFAVVVATDRGHRAREALRDWRDARGYRGALAFGVLGGVALALNYYAWPPALLFTAILTTWLTVVVLLENAKPEGDARGFVFGAGVSFVVSSLLMAPAVEDVFLGSFNTFGILHVVAGFAATAWLAGVHAASRAARARGLPGWSVPAGIAGLAVVGFLGVKYGMPVTYNSLLWGLTWVTGFGVQRTMLTIAEARQAAFFCTADTSTQSCLATDFGFVPQVSFLVLVALAGWVLWKRRRADILLLLWSLVVFRATDTQIRFSYYLALNMALLLGWVAARAAEATGLERAHADEGDEPTRHVPVRAAAPGKGGRRTRKAQERAPASVAIQLAAVGAVLLVVLPGNVFANGIAQPGWESVRFGGPDAELKVWMDGLDWMRVSTPDAGVDLAAIVEAPPPGETYDYPPETYGVLSWWDYGHWIQTVAQRPPVANPFQQAAPFASLWFTERDPARAEEMLTEWERGQGPVRYVVIDDEMATGKYGAITVWANSQNASRDRWADGSYRAGATYSLDGRGLTVQTVGPQYLESMMGRLYDQDALGLSHYRLVWEHPEYSAIGSVAADDGQLRCLHDLIPSRSCPIGIGNEHFQAWRPGAAVRLGEDANAYDLLVASRLKVFERVEGARLVGTAEPGALVTASVALMVEQPDGRVRNTGWQGQPLVHEVRATAGPDGTFELTFPYSTADPVPPAEGGTAGIVRAQGPVLVTAGASSAQVDVPDRAVLDGLDVPVAFG